MMHMAEPIGFIFQAVACICENLVKNAASNSVQTVSAGSCAEHFDGIDLDQVDSHLALSLRMLNLYIFCMLTKGLSADLDTHGGLRWLGAREADCPHWCAACHL